MSFEYEVVEAGNVINVEYEDEDPDEPFIQAERPVILKSLTSSWRCNEFYCIICGEDANKPLRKGELISAELHFSVKKDDDESYVQKITAEDVFTLNDFHQILEAEAHYEGRLSH